MGEDHAKKSKMPFRGENRLAESWPFSISRRSVFNKNMVPAAGLEPA